MPMVMECPFYKRDGSLKLTCEGASVRFPDKDSRSEFVLGYCANSYRWRQCPVAHMLENYYFRKEEA